jgi:hypothetical protein
MADQYFTSTALSKHCYKTLIEYMKENKTYYGFSKNREEPTFLEPACGNGSFFYLLPRDRRIGYEIDKDLCKQHTEFICADFMNIKHLSIPFGSKTKSTNVVAIGNPPFTDGKGKQTGRKVNMQARFINKCGDLGCNYVGFIVGASMNRLQSKSYLPNMKLVKSIFLPDTTFASFQDGKRKTYSVYFNIYTRLVPFGDQKTRVESIRQTLKNVARPKYWKLISAKEHIAINKINIALVRWGSTATIFNFVQDKVLLKKLIEQESKKLKKYKTNGPMFTCSRYFFIQFENQYSSEFDKFIYFVKSYARSISTTSSTSIGKFEIYLLWNKFLLH